MNKYDVMWGGTYIGSKNMMDGTATIEGETFEEAREKFFQDSLESGIRMGLIERFSIQFIDLKTGEIV